MGFLCGELVVFWGAALPYMHFCGIIVLRKIIALLVSAESEIKNEKL